MNKVNKKHITGLITIVAIAMVLISAGCIGDDVSSPSSPTSTPTRTTTPPPSPAPTPATESRTLSVSELLESPVYGTEVKVYGTVSSLGALFCPCFTLATDGKMFTVHYDLMVDDDGTERHSASVEGIKNGDRVIVTGELRSSSGTVPSTTFWASNVEKTVERGAAQGDERINLANVNTIEIMILESFPVQINVAARGEHPDSCTKVDEITTVREGNTFVVTINAFRPTDAMCAQVITPYEEVVALDVFELKAGVYTVDVNGIRDTFELQMDN